MKTVYSALLLTAVLIGAHANAMSPGRYIDMPENAKPVVEAMQSMDFEEAEQAAIEAILIWNRHDLLYPPFIGLPTYRVAHATAYSEQMSREGVLVEAILYKELYRFVRELAQKAPGVNTPLKIVLWSQDWIAKHFPEFAEGFRELVAAEITIRTPFDAETSPQLLTDADTNYDIRRLFHYLAHSPTRPLVSQWSDRAWDRITYRTRRFDPSLTQTQARDHDIAAQVLPRLNAWDRLKIKTLYWTESCLARLDAKSKSKTGSPYLDRMLSY